jgi:acyl-CoA synthetase (AMP-forming)/AMP-acid ligase II
MISTSPNVTIPSVPITDYVLRHAARLGDKPALIDGPTGRTLTYRQLADGVRRTAAGLARRGFGKGRSSPSTAPTCRSTRWRSSGWRWRAGSTPP